MDRVCRPRWWFVSDKLNLLSTVECFWIQRNHWSAKCSPSNASRKWRNVTSWLRVPDTCSPLCDFIAQLVRALHRHRRGHGFESRWVTWIFQVHETIAYNKLSSKCEDHIFIWFQTPHCIQHFFHIIIIINKQGQMISRMRGLIIQAKWITNSKSLQINM